MSNPFINNKKTVAIYFSIWYIILLVQLLLLTVVLEVKFVFAAADSSIYNILYAVFGIGIWYTVRYNSLENYSTTKLALNHFAAAVIASGLWIVIGYFLLRNIFLDEKVYQTFLYKSLVWRFLIGILYYVVLVSVYYLIIYYNNFQAKLVNEAELNSLVKEAELKSLKYQINPHFIFNSLNSISSLTLSNPAKAQEMTIKLSSFLRGTLSKNEKQKNKLMEEITNAKLYLDIEKIRFADKFEFVEIIKDECKEMEVPSMILQPLLENAIKHGVYESLQKVTIKLFCHVEKEYFKIVIENNFDPESIPRKGEGIGMKNIQNRLKLIYQQDNLLTYEKRDSVFKVNIFIPLENAYEKQN